MKRDFIHEMIKDFQREEYFKWVTERSVSKSERYLAELKRRLKNNKEHMGALDSFAALATLTTGADAKSKNSFPFCQDDMDTSFGTPNFPPGKYAVNVGKKEYLRFIYDEFIKVPEDGYYAYDFALVNNGKVIAIGNEQGRCGGVTDSCRDKNFEDRLKKSPVYDKVKHLPIATEDELEEPIYKYFDSHTKYENYMKNSK